MTADEMVLLGHYNPSADFTAIVLCILLWCMFNQVTVKSHNTYKLFMTMFMCVIVAATGNIVFYALVKTNVYKTAIGSIWLFITRDLYHCLLLTSMYLFVKYCVDMVDMKLVVEKRVKLSLTVIWALACLFDVLSPVTKFGFHLESNGVWVDDSWIKPYTVGYISLFCGLGLLLLFQGHRIFRKVKVSLVCVCLLSAFVMLLNTIFNNNTMATVIFLFPILTVMFMVHTNSYNINTGTLGEESLIDFLGTKTGKFKVYSFIFDNYDRTQSKKAKIYFCNFWYKYMKKGNAFFIDNNTLLILISDNKRTVEEDYEFLTQSIQGFSDYDLHVSGVLFNQDLPMKFDDFVFNLDYAKSVALKNSAYIFKAEDNNNMMKQKYILDQLRDIEYHQDLHDDRVLVYCQPVKNVHNNKFDTAEALMRLELPEYGLIPPGLFIPLAEKYKLVHSLSIIIFNKVCEAIRYFDEEGYDLNRISVNFAVQEFRNTNFASELVKIIKDNQIDSNRIAIEVTESENDEEFQLLERVISQLKELQIHLYLDDFGTGYSNFDRIFGLKLNVVKFDRSFLLMADADAKSKFLIKHFSSAFNQMGYEVLYEGVETDAQEQLCVEANADYLQGYKYGKPVPIYDLVKFLSLK